MGPSCVHGGQVWDVVTLQRVHKLEGHARTVRAMLVAGGRLITGSDDCSVGVWDVERREQLAQLRITLSVRGLAVCGDVLVRCEEQQRKARWDGKR